MKMNLSRASFSAIGLLGMCLTSSASGQERGELVFAYCMGNPPTTVRTSFVYVSDVFAHRLSVMDRSIERVTTQFRQRVESEYNQPIGATCLYESTRDAAEYERSATIQHRRNNGYTVELVDGR